MPPSRAPAHLDRIGQMRPIERRQASPEQRPENAMDKSPWATVDQRERGRNDGMLGRSQRDFLGERDPKHHPCLAVVRKALPGRTVDQRIEVGKAAKDLARNRDGEAKIGSRQIADSCSGGLEGLASPKHRIEHLQRRAPGRDPVSAWHWVSGSSF
jgi:hypothetical protein